MKRTGSMITAAHAPAMVIGLDEEVVSYPFASKIDEGAVVFDTAELGGLDVEWSSVGCGCGRSIDQIDVQGRAHLADIEVELCGVKSALVVGNRHRECHGCRAC